MLPVGAQLEYTWTPTVEWDSTRTPIEFQWVSNLIQMGCQWDSGGIPANPNLMYMGSRWIPRVLQRHSTVNGIPHEQIPLEILLDSHMISNAVYNAFSRFDFESDSNWIPCGCQRDSEWFLYEFNGMHVGCKLDSGGMSLGLLWCVVGFCWGSNAIPFGLF